MKCIPPHTQLLYSKSGVYRGYTYFLFLIQNRFWVLFRTAVLLCTHNQCFENIKNIDFFFSNEISLIFFSAEKDLCILHGQVFIK